MKSKKEACAADGLVFDEGEKLSGRPPHYYRKPISESRSKGVAILVSHALLIGFTIFLVFVVVSTFTTLRDDFQEFTAKSEIDQLCFIVKSTAEKVFQQVVYRSASNTTYGQLDVKLPEKIGGLAYRARLENASVFVDTLSPRFNATCKVGFPANFSGTTTGGTTRISFSRNLTSGLIEMKNV